MKARRQEIDELQNCDFLPKLLQMGETMDISNDVPILLNKSFSEGCDPFESVRQSLSNGTLEREKIFSKIKVCQDIRIGGNVGSSFNPIAKIKTTSHRTASSSYDSNLNEEESEKRNPIIKENMNQACETQRISQNLNRNEIKFKSLRSNINENLLDFLDNYPSDVLQKTAMVLIEKSLSRSHSFEIPARVSHLMLNSKISNNSDKDSAKNELESQEDSEFKPCNCRKSKCLKLY